MPERPSRRRPQSGPSDRFVAVEVPSKTSQERFLASVEELVAGELVGVGDGLAASPAPTSAARPARLGTPPARRAVCRTLGAGPTRTRRSAGGRRMPRPASASPRICGDRRTARCCRREPLPPSACHAQLRCHGPTSNRTRPQQKYALIVAIWLQKVRNGGRSNHHPERSVVTPAPSTWDAPRLRRKGSEQITESGWTVRGRWGSRMAGGFPGSGRRAGRWLRG